MSAIIIAEAGVNHNGSLELAKKMALVAKDFDGNAESVRKAVDALCDKYPLFE